VPARPASTVIVLRPSSDGFELLMVRRAERAEFMGDAYVFPGGSVDDIDRDDLALRAVHWTGDPEEAPWRAAALRELVEEAGLSIGDGPLSVTGLGAEVYEAVIATDSRLDASRLAYLSNWVTPVGLPKRFDTRFYVAIVEVGTEAAADAVEVFDSVWVRPADALARSEEWKLPFPTRRHLEFLTEFVSPESVMAHAADLETVPRIEPRLAVGDNGTIRVLLPGDSGYEAAVR
jgi:8-oxo-dGTP pyrophosphatase MutT (NUDIX family)